MNYGNYYLDNKNVDNVLKKNSALSSIESEDPPNTIYHWRIDQFNILHDFDDGWFGGYMEIYFRVSYKHPGGAWSNSYIPFNVIDGVTAGRDWWHGVPAGWDLYSSTNSSDVIKFEVWEFDGFFNGNDDHVADTNWETVAYIPSLYTWRTNVVEFPHTITWLRAIDTSDPDEDYIDLHDYITN